MNQTSKEEIAQNLDDLRQEASHIVEDAVDSVKGKARAVGTAAKTVYQQTHDKVVTKALVTDWKIRNNIYTSLGIAVGVGVVVGLMMTSSRRQRRIEYEDYEG